MADNTELLAMMGEVLRAIDRPTEANQQSIREATERQSRVIEHLLEATSNGFGRLEAKLDQTNNRLDQTINRLDQTNNRLDQVVSSVNGLETGMARTEERLDSVVEHLGHLTERVTAIDNRLERIEAQQPAYQDVVRRLTVPEGIVLRRAS